MKDNMILIGMPGAGKSTVGVVLAKTLGLGFVDSDLVIQDREGRLLQEIINSDGMDAFLKCEEAAVRSIGGSGKVIATGGSVVYKEGAMAHLKDLGKVVYLRVSFEEIDRRINNISTRGIAIREGATLKDVYGERVALYETYADITIDCDKSVEDTVESIVGMIRRGL